MELHRTEQGFALYKEKDCIGECCLSPAPKGAQLAALCILPRWRRKGYGSYLLKEVLRSFGGYDREAATVFTAPLPENAAELAFWGKFGFAAEGGQLVRRRTPDLTAVKFVQDFLAARLVHPQLCVDATCGNGGDTTFLCGLTAPPGGCWPLTCSPKPSAPPAPGWNRQMCPPSGTALSAAATPTYYSMCSPALPMQSCSTLAGCRGADHAVFSTAQSSIPALQAALQAVRPGGIVSAILYSRAVIGSDEKQAVLRFLRALPLKKFHRSGV